MVEGGERRGELSFVYPMSQPLLKIDRPYRVSNVSRQVPISSS